MPESWTCTPFTHFHECKYFYSHDLRRQSFMRPSFQLVPVQGLIGEGLIHPGIPKQSALPFLRTLREAGILQVLRESSGRRSAVLAFPALLNCAEGRMVF